MPSKNVDKRYLLPRIDVNSFIEANITVSFLHNLLPDPLLLARLGTKGAFPRQR